MKRLIYILFAFLFFPAIAIGEECNFPILSSDSKINAYLLENYVATYDNKLNFMMDSTPGCLDTAFLADELSQEEKMGEFELALKISILEVRLAKIFRNLYKDPNASVYLCPYKNKESEFKILTESVLNFMITNTGRSKKEIKDLMDTIYQEKNCRLIPKIEVNAWPRNIPIRILAYIITELYKKLGKPFPPEILESLEKTRPFEPNILSPVKSSPIPLM